MSRVLANYLGFYPRLSHTKDSKKTKKKKTVLDSSLLNTHYNSQTSRPTSRPRWLREFLRYLFRNSSSSHLFTFFLSYRLPECSILSKSYALCKRRPTIPSPECSTPVGKRIYCHPQTDCFVLSELFSVARHAGRLKPGSKPVQLFIYIYIYTHTQMYISIIYVSVCMRILV